jgi:hypothetical protein
VGVIDREAARALDEIPVEKGDSVEQIRQFASVPKFSARLIR